MTTVSTGAGRCQPTHQLSIRPAKAVIELGAVADVIRTALNAAHHANRHGDPDDRIAVALPGLHVRRGVARPGHEVVLFGSESALGAFVRLDGVQTLVRRGMVKGLEVREVFCAWGERGTAYVRDRQSARRSPGAIRRALERAARRGVQMPGKIETRPTDPALLALHFGSAVVHVREIEAQIGDKTVLVNTYGFSSPGAPAVLPILPDGSVRWTDDAA
jgi:hypothetical protein